MCAKTIIAYLKEHILTCLDEIMEELYLDSDYDFLIGETYAYLECLEIILQNEGVDDEELLALEERYGIR